MVAVGWVVAPTVAGSPGPSKAAQPAPSYHHQASSHEHMSSSSTADAGGRQRTAADSGGAAACEAGQPKGEQPAAGSPCTVTALLGAAAAACDAQSAGPATPPAQDGSAATASESAASAGRQEPASPPPGSPAFPATPSVATSQGDARSQGSAAAAADLHAPAAAPTTHERSMHRFLRSTSSIGGGSAAGGSGGAATDALDIPALVDRLKQRPLTGQVVAWGWEAAASISSVRRTMPAQLFSALWPATQACACRMMPQDVLEMLESWLTLMQHCPRHFRLSRAVLEELATYALPAAVKRMGEDQLAQLAVLARDIALHRSEADYQLTSAHQSGSSARDLMQPVFALVAAEVAWRCNNPARYVSAETVSAALTAAPAWSWRVVRHRDPHALVALKLATAAALEELVPHSPQDLPRSALGKLKTDSLSSPRLSSHASA